MTQQQRETLNYILKIMKQDEGEFMANIIRSLEKENYRLREEIKDLQVSLSRRNRVDPVSIKKAVKDAAKEVLEDQQDALKEPSREV